MGRPGTYKVKNIHKTRAYTSLEGVMPGEEAAHGISKQEAEALEAAGLFAIVGAPKASKKKAKDADE